MGKIATRLNITLFGLLLLGFVVIQYSWLTTLHKDKLGKFRGDLVSGVNDAVETLAVTGSLRTLTDTAITNALHRSFATKGLGTLSFEYNLVLGTVHLNSSGFNRKLTNSPNNLTLHYLFQNNNLKPAKEDFLEVIIPHANGLVWKQMTGTILLSALLTLMMLTVFYYATRWGRSGQQLFSIQRDHLIANMMQQLEAPLTTVSVAAEALRNATVMRDVTKIRFYQQVINEENKRMNDEVKRLLRELE